MPFVNEWMFNQPMKIEAHDAGAAFFLTGRHRRVAETSTIEDKKEERMLLACSLFSSRLF
jgi:hypothetical protein